MAHIFTQIICFCAIVKNTQMYVHKLKNYKIIWRYEDENWINSTKNEC